MPFFDIHSKNSGNISRIAKPGIAQRGTIIKAATRTISSIRKGASPPYNDKQEVRSIWQLPAVSWVHRRCRCIQTKPGCIPGYIRQAQVQ